MTPSTATRGVTILGATGSIGTAALRVIDRHRDRFHVRGLTAHSNATLLAEQVAAWRPAYVGLVQGAAAKAYGSLDIEVNDGVVPRDSTVD